MISMTGYASHRVSIAGVNYTITIKSWNNRFLDVSLQLPGSLQAIERNCREAIEQRIHRGKVECSVRSDGNLATSGVLVNRENLANALVALRSMRDLAGIEEPLTLANLLAFENILQFDKAIDGDEFWLAFQPALVQCIQDFDADRRREGAATRLDIQAKLEILSSAIQAIGQQVPVMDAAIKNGLRSRFEEVMGSLVDENRILAEIAAYLAKHTINEELVRFKAHLAAFQAAMDEVACGKKLDFISQELNREANTIGSKNCLSEMALLVIVIKEAVENIREQIRNIE
ncbi:MAG: YicC family protein [Spirochaetes bacterium GWD1_61_31]|nr:MAG: YicC family protein [Spirochaetes bacterium GWB1_60_80]OHD29648.1 MAG: YicC family protein [Spirochaetes bacterium GWC1_61_12]OHD34705.1 MAG: YicC family protein [Spirochaetes bacterium GWD1_61_31]OHD41937.1 MAG: YicC family protein [Spirochaetes bacterium GWE1_60_18]OHD61797.1 MAG: YicC family protein [Spirochaetes bacterium GWF1_60_12]HAW85156.1 YicC family protein [Spirochaetaceae bacterium]